MEDALIKELKKHVFKDMLTGIYLVRMTGKVLEDDKSYIQVIVNGKETFAKPCMPFPWYSVPDEDWIDANKEKFGCWIMYENSNSAYPVWVGMAPLDGQVPNGDSYPKCREFDTPQMWMQFDDDAKEMRVQTKKNKMGALITEDNVDLGEEDADKELTVKFDSLASIMDDLIGAIENIQVPTAMGTSGTPINIAEFEALAERWEEFKSKSVRVD